MADGDAVAPRGWLNGRRIVLDPDGVTWMVSARGDESDFNYDSPGPDAAVAGTVGRHAIPARIHRVLRAGDDVLVFETTDGLWVLVGNPHVGGRMGPAEPVATTGGTR